MANIAQYLQNIATAIYGKDVRSSIHDAIDIINKVGEKQITAGTEITSGDPKGSYYENSLYINTATNELLRCGSSTWTVIGNIKGETGVGISEITGPVTEGLVDTYTIVYTNSTSRTFSVVNGADGENGNGIASITGPVTEGLVDTYTITLDDGTTKTFTVTNGEDGEDGSDGQNGNVWGTGEALTGTGTRLVGYPGVIGDCYLNTVSNNVYQCIKSGTVSTAEWNYITNIKGQSGTGTGDMQSNTYASTAKTQGLSNVVDSALSLYGLLSTVTELNFLQGISSNVQTQLNGKIDSPVSSVGADKVPVSKSGGGYEWKDYGGGGSGASTWSELNGKPFDSVNTSNGLNTTGGVLDVTMPTVDQTYNSSSSHAQSGTAVAGAIVSKVDKPANSVPAGKVATSTGSGGVSWDDPAAGGHEMLPDPSDEPTQEEVIEAISAVSADSDNENVVSAYSVANWSNGLEKTHIMKNIPANKNEVGTWQTGDKSSWVTTSWWFIPDLLGVTSNDNIDIVIGYNPAREEPISVIGYQLNDDDTRTINGQTVHGGSICIKIGAHKNICDLTVTLTKKHTEVTSYNYSELYP